MNSIERTLRTLEHRLPDRVPVDLHNFLVTARMMGAASFADFFRDGEAMAEGVRLAYHICGNATPIMGDVVNTGAAIIEIDQKADMRTCKEAARGKATLLGPIDPSDVLANGTPESVIEKCREALEILSPGGGFILGPGCALPATTPDENIDALIETAKRHGRYLA
jgi:uroporphyrinogen-III decarboxylase